MSKVDELIDAVKALPEEAVEDLLRRAQAWQPKEPVGPPYRPVALGGLWKGVTLTENDLREARREVWSRFSGAE